RRQGMGDQQGKHGDGDVFRSQKISGGTSQMSKILIVEDEEAIADLEKDYLELSGFEVEIACDGVIGLKRALAEDFQLVILELMLPGVDGFEICRVVREVGSAH